MSLEDSLLTAIDEYYEKFGEPFPTMEFQTDTTKETLEKVLKCIKSEQRAERFFNIDYGNGILY